MTVPLVARYSALVVAGPTAVGKTDLAVEIALRCGGEVVGADAFQIYEGLDLLTAKPSTAERRRVAHHAIGEVPLSQAFDVAQFLVLAERHLAAIRARGAVPVIVGGTGLYVRALLRGLAPLPPADAALRVELESVPLGELQTRLREMDPTSAASIDLRNPRRVIRALEVCLLTGRAFSSFHQEWDAAPGEAGVVFLRDREELTRRIDRRVEAMFAAGVVEEVRAVGEVSLTASQTLGLREIREHIAGHMTRAECISAIQMATRRYAKRQVTWFRKEVGLRPVHLTPGVPQGVTIEGITRSVQAVA